MTSHLASSSFFSASAVSARAAKATAVAAARLGEEYAGSGEANHAFSREGGTRNTCNPLYLWNAVLRAPKRCPVRLIVI